MSKTGKRSPSAGRCRWLLIPFALGYAWIMLGLDAGASWYGISPYHRLQAFALLHGHLSLGDSIDQMSLGLAWHNGHVQQVWGLGVGFWLAPFAAVWRLLGGSVFPDQLALGSAFALLALYAGATGLRIVREGRMSAGVGLIWIILLFPPLWTLARASQLVFEETALYANILSLCLLVALVRVAWFDAAADLWIAVVLGAFSGFVRPTHLAYGLTAALVCLMVRWRRHRRPIETACGAVVVLAGISLLAWTNSIRFGSPLEFGHRLTATSGSQAYLTRFGNPYANARASEAAKELFGLLFLDSKVKDAGAFAERQFPGQSEQARWRRLSLTTFDPSYVVAGLLAIGCSLRCFLRRIRQPTNSPPAGVVAGLCVWSCVAMAALTCFYFRFPVIASRYLLDFLPAMAGFVVLTWFFLSARLPRVSLAVLAGWLVYGIAIAKTPVPDDAGTPWFDRTLPHATGIPLKDFAGFYTVSHHPAESGIPGNGNGWEPESGFADNIVTIIVDHPTFVELHVDARREFNGEPARPDVYRAQLGGVLLPPPKTTREPDGIKVVFEIPQEMRARRGDELLVLCFSSGYDAEDRMSERILHSVKWRP